jgi:hypothetical protein
MIRLPESSIETKVLAPGSKWKMKKPWTKKERAADDISGPKILNAFGMKMPALGKAKISVIPALLDSVESRCSAGNAGERMRSGEMYKRTALVRAPASLWRSRSQDPPSIQAASLSAQTSDY